MKVGAHIVVWTLVMLLPARIPANHYEWWKCTAQCRRCIRRTTPLEHWISEYYSGLFSKEPPSPAFYDSSLPPTPKPDNRTPQVTTRNPYVNPPPDTPSPNTRFGTHECCETEIGHWAPNDMEYEGRKYSVVHLKQEYQFIPVGRCRMDSNCTGGTCVQVLRAHWVLVFNNTSPLTTAPVGFLPIKVPSHCECLNIGRSKSRP